MEKEERKFCLKEENLSIKTEAEVVVSFQGILSEGELFGYESCKHELQTCQIKDESIDDVSIKEEILDFTDYELCVERFKSSIWEERLKFVDESDSEIILNEDQKVQIGDELLFNQIKCSKLLHTNLKYLEINGHQLNNNRNTSIQGYSEQDLTANLDFNQEKSLDGGDQPGSASASGANYVNNSVNFKNKIKFVQQNIFRCSLCSYQSEMKKRLKRHARIHTGEKPYKCGDCSYSSTCFTNLKRHKRIHTGEKPFKCEQCPFNTAQSSHLKEHYLRIHSGEKPFKCGKCAYSAATNYSLKRHVKIHSELKPFKCGDCSYAAKSSKTLKIHLRMYCHNI